ncbi:MAG: sodium-dependent transporter [Rikenellaceae bacterium]|nr:sodium-dependent transporter [Rikenellaceae bacterium]
MKHTQHERATFGSSLGVILASAGSAIGLGNIWRFPYETGQNGGAAFLLIYILSVLLLGLPVLMTEFFIGRAARSNPAGAFRKLAPGSHWQLVGYNGVLAAVLILGFYGVVAGWTLEYIWQSLDGTIAATGSSEAFTRDFENFSSSLFRPVLWMAVFMIMTHVIIVSGVKKGIEKYSKIMMPLLFVILLVLCLRSVTLPGAVAGLRFLFKPDFGKITSEVVLSAVGQAFFSISVGMGCMITYASYFGKETDIQKTALQVTLLDTLVAVMAGVIIFPAAASFGIATTKGPELVFITLPNIFQQMLLGSVWSAIFFLLLAIAALTSTISIHEVITAYVSEHYRMSRRNAARTVTAIVTALGIVASLSLGVWSGYKVFGLTLFDLLDYVTAKIMLPLGGMFTCIFVGWRIDRTLLHDEMTNHGTVRFWMFRLFVFMIKYIAPIVIALVFLNELGVFGKA